MKKHTDISLIKKIIELKEKIRDIESKLAKLQKQEVNNGTITMDQFINQKNLPFQSSQQALLYRIVKCIRINAIVHK